MAEIFLEERILECGICFERMDETCRMLPCQHTYCKACLENLNQHEGCLRCPQCRNLVTVAVNDLPKNFVLLNLIEQVKRNPPLKPKTEDEELATAITLSREKFMNEKATDLLLKHNEQLQTQLALENSKREAVLQSAKEMSAEYNELFQYQVAIEKSEEDESIRKKNQNLITEKEKLECELALLKSQLDTNATGSTNSTTGMTSLFSWFATHSSDLSDEQRREAQIVLQRVRLAMATQSNDFTQKQLQAVIDKMKACGSKKYPGQKEAKSEVENDGAIDDVMDKLKEVNTMLRHEESSQHMRMNERFYGNYLNYPPNFIPPLMHDPRMFGPKFYDPRLPHPPPHFFPVSPQPSFYWPPSACPPRFSGYPGHSGPMNFPDRGKNITHGRGGHGRGGASSKPVFEKMGLNKLADSRNKHGDATGSLILPDVRDYKRLDKKRDDNANHEKSNESSGEPSSSSGGKKRGPLLLPDVRHYDMVYSKFPDHLNTSDHTKHDTESFGRNFPRRRKSFDSVSESGYSTRNDRGTYRGRKPYRGRGGPRSTFNSKPSECVKNDGSESDSSGTSMVSCSSRYSSCSTSVRSRDGENKYRGNNNQRRSRGSNYRGSRKNFQRKDGIFEDNYKKENDMKRLTYPTKEEALKKNIDLTKPFTTPVICLGKDANKPVSQTVECLADVYKFEEMYQECRIIRI